MTTIRCPKEGLADMLRRIAEHADKYVVDNLSIAFDGTVYRISIEGSGELLVDTESSGDDDLVGIFEDEDS